MSKSMQGVLVDLPVFHDQAEIPARVSNESEALKWIAIHHEKVGQCALLNYADYFPTCSPPRIAGSAPARRALWSAIRSASSAGVAARRFGPMSVPNCGLTAIPPRIIIVQRLAAGVPPERHLSTTRIRPPPA